MGYYIQVPDNLGKAQQIVDLYGAEVLAGPPVTLADLPEGKAAICVVQNGLFDAAGIAYDDKELQEFAYPDGRPRTWLSMDIAKVIELCPQVASQYNKEG
jgi:hypothetical protein